MPPWGQPISSSFDSVVEQIGRVGEQAMNPTLKFRSIMSGVLMLAATQVSSLHAENDTSVLAPKGELRVALVTSNPALVTRDVDGQFRGVAIDLANALATKLGVPSRVVPYENSTRYNLSLGKDEWDIAVGPRDLSRIGQLAFSDVFMEADTGYEAIHGAA